MDGSETAGLASPLPNRFSYMMERSGGVTSVQRLWLGRHRRTVYMDVEDASWL